MGKQTYIRLDLARFLCKPEAGIERFTPDYTDKVLLTKLRCFQNLRNNHVKRALIFHCLSTLIFMNQLPIA